MNDIHGYIEERVREALRILARLPAERRPRLALSRWPDIARDAFESFNPTEPGGWGRTQVRLRGAAPDEIVRLEEVLGWLWWLDRDERSVLLARRLPRPVTWRDLQTIDGRSHMTLHKLYRSALRKISTRLTACDERVFEKSKKTVGRIL
jgi:hypothetical protein